jgi:uncharacterized membrane protein (DUF4010 family)
VQQYEPFLSLAVALGVGFLIGLQREQASGSARFLLGGIRTFPLVALAGALASLLGRQFGFWPIGIGMAGLAALLALAYADDIRKDRDRGITTEIAFFLTFLLGALALTEGIVEPIGTRLQVVAALGVVVTALLSVKQPLHELAAKVSKEDILATVKFAIAAVIVLPLLPDRTFGPLDVLNPFQAGLMVVLISGLSYLGYIAIRVLGPGRGLGVTAVLGGMVSSTAVTLALSDRSKREPSVGSACAMGVVLASTIMFFRVMVEVQVVDPGLLPSVAIPMGTMAATGLGAAAILFLRGRSARTEEGPKLSNPFELSSAIKFGLLFLVVLFLSKAATVYLGRQGIFVAGFLAGSTDVDAITLSMANLTRRGTVAHADAATAILLACVSNTLVKGGLAIALGAPGFRSRVAWTFLWILLAGGASVSLLWVF